MESYTLLYCNNVLFSHFQSCRNPLGTDCYWYQDCLDKYNPCYGSDEYAISYGYHYCNQYTMNLYRFSSRAQDWIRKTKRCLQLALKSYVGTSISCSALKKAAFDSHTKCYVDNGFCDLSTSDYKEITKLVGNALIPFSGSAWLTSVNGGSTLYSCSRRYASALADDVRDSYRNVVNSLKDFFG